uniref:DUF6697 domain-containing protein n=1 Tax=Psilocybe cubensis TaxID=181762 RepID=A0A8H7Y9A5_PSICU
MDETARLKAQLVAMERENAELKHRLKEVELGMNDTNQLVLNGNMQVEFQQADTKNVLTLYKSQKRARSSSLDLVEIGRDSKVYNLPVPQETPVKNLGHVDVNPHDKTFKASPQTPSWPVKLSPRNFKIKKGSPSESKSILKLEKDDPEIEPDAIEGQGSEENELVLVARAPENGSNSACNVEEAQNSSLAPHSSQAGVYNEPEHNVHSTTPINLSAIAKEYLQSSNALIVSPSPDTLLVPRKYLRLIYGGSDQQFFQYIQDNLNPSGKEKRRMVFPQLESNPSMPMRPGQPGLLYSSRYELLHGSYPWTVFCKPDASKALWLYLASQYNGQESKTKIEWAQRLLKAKAHDVYISMRARIALRKYGQLLPSTSKADEETLIRSEIKSIKINKGMHLTENDIIDAFSKGEEGIDIIRMTCIQYDHVFLNDMKTRYSSYSALCTASREKKNARESDRGKEGRSLSVKQAPKHVTTQKSSKRRKLHDGDASSLNEGCQEYEEPESSSKSSIAPRRSSRKSVANGSYANDSN